MDNRSLRVKTLSLGVGAFILRLFFILIGGRGVGISPGSDAVSYDEFARLMLTGWHWVTTPLAVREPLYPAFMALSYALPGGKIFSLQVLQALLGGFGVAILYFGLQSATRERVAFLAAALVALNPHFIFYTIYPYRENLVIFLLVCSLVAFIRMAGSDKAITVAGAALVYALLIHADVRFLPLSLTFPLMIYLISPSGKWALKKSLWFGFFLMLFMIPYQVRGFVAFGKPVVVTERFLGRWIPMVNARFSGKTNVEKANDKSAWLEEWETEKKAKLEQLTPGERFYFLKGGRPAVSRMSIYWYHLKEYWRFVRVSPSYRPYPEELFESPWSFRHNLVSSLVVLPFFLLFPFIWISSPREERRIALALLVFLLAHMLMHVAVLALERYRIPIESITLIMMAMGLANVWSMRFSSFHHSNGGPG